MPFFSAADRRILSIMPYTASISDQPDHHRNTKTPTAAYLAILDQGTRHRSNPKDISDQREAGSKFKPPHANQIRNGARDRSQKAKP
jgi:hypothetical protein